MVRRMIRHLVLKTDPEAEKRLEELDNLKKKFNRLTRHGQIKPTRSDKANLLAITYNKKKYWFQPPLPVVMEETVQ